MTDAARNNCEGRGIDLAFECAYLGQWSDPLATDSGVSMSVGQPAIPASALVPRFGEPLIRADTSWPPHPRGSGQFWPPEAYVDHTSLCGRLPMAYAWELLQRGKRWEWSDGSDPVDGANAICAVIRDVCGRPVLHRQQPPVVLVIPNTLSEPHQQDLVDAGRAEGLDVKLLWRPVAAALSWCNANSQKLREHPHEIDNPMGRILALHMGFDVFEAAVLDVVPRMEENRTWFLPARHRPDRQRDATESFGYDLLVSVTNECLRAENRTPTTPAIWGRMWCSSWIRCVLESLVEDNSEASSQYERQVHSAIAFDSLRDVWRSQMGGILKARAADNPIDGDPGGYLCGRFDTSRFIEWQSDSSGNIGKEPLLGAVVTGPLASAPGSHHETLGHTFLRKLGCTPETAMLEGAGLPFGTLARGAACYSSRLHAGLPTYLDTLPRIQTVIRQQGEPVWINLLSDDDSFVDGGREWRRPNNLDNLEIQENQSELTLAVNHEEHPYVREVTASLHQEFEEKQPVSLAVAIEPAQGSAKLEVVPDDANLFGRHRIIVNWKGMKDFQDDNGDTKTPEEYLECLSRIYPPLSEREHSRSKWRSVKHVMQDATARLVSHPTAYGTHTTIERVLEAVKSKDADYYREHKDATAVSSNGKVNLNQEVLEKFVTAMCAALPQVCSDRAKVCIRTLGYTSTDNPTFREIILSEVRDFLRGDRRGLGQHILTSCGWCLREPEHIAIYAKACERYMRSHDTNLNVWLKALSEILRYRGNATSAIDTSLANYLVGKALDTFTAQRENRNGNYLFRYSCLIIVYLLRRRAYDDEFLPPEDTLAVQVKEEFRRAIQDCNNDRLKLVGGSVDLAAALQTMIDYIDRRGRGSILLSTD